MPRKKRTERDLAHEGEVLDSLVDPVDPQNEDPAIRALLSPEFVTMSNVDATQIALALQQIIRGQNAASDQLSKLTKRMDNYDKAEAAWRRDQEKFIRDTLDKADHQSKTEREKLRAKGLKVYKQTRDQAVAERVSDHLQFDAQLAAMPTVDLAVAGRPEMTRDNSGQQVLRLVGEEIRIKSKVWRLEPGRIYKVPIIVKKRYDEIMRDRAENSERAALLDGSKQDMTVAAGMQAISAKYGGKSEAFPLASQ